tara:strand:- start:75 stop:413 length:339 start_codon:yes stop_codon:yes gene_type:complete
MNGPFKSKGPIQIKGGYGRPQRPNANQFRRINLYDLPGTVTSTGKIKTTVRTIPPIQLNNNDKKSYFQRSLERADSFIDRRLRGLRSFGLEDMPSLTRNPNRRTAFLRKKIF